MFLMQQGMHNFRTIKIATSRKSVHIQSEMLKYYKIVFQIIKYTSTAKYWPKLL